MKNIALAEISNQHVPMNNWQAKRINITGYIGYVLNNDSLIQYALSSYKEYISKALYADGSSNDLIERDALSYHIGGLEPLLRFLISTALFSGHEAYSLFSMEGYNGGSVKKAVAYVLPYARGEKTYYQWKNSKVELDKQRAIAGIEEYLPGPAFKKEKSWPMFELACYFDTSYCSIVPELTWISLMLRRQQ